MPRGISSATTQNRRSRKQRLSDDRLRLQNKILEARLIKMQPPPKARPSRSKTSDEVLEIYQQDRAVQSEITRLEALIDLEDSRETLEELSVECEARQIDIIPAPIIEKPPQGGGFD